MSQKLKNVALSTAQLKYLKKLLGEDKVLTSNEEKVVYSYDASKRKYSPSVIVLPGNLDDIVHVLRFADSEKIPVYPRGAGSGMSGGALPLLGGISLVFTRMNKILDIDTVNQMVTVEPGVVLDDLKKTVEAHNLYYPPDPASAEFATIGGTIAECAGGLRCIKYGVTRDYVRWLEVVRMGGEILHFGSEAIKSVSGYDILRLLVGSEGTLAVFSKIKLRLIPRPQYAKTMIAMFDDDSAALTTAIALLQSGLIPSALEFIDTVSLGAVYSYSRNDLIKDVHGMLLIEFDGKIDEVDTDIARAESLLIQQRAANVSIAQDENSADSFWKIRRNISPSMYELGPVKANEDIAVPRSELLSIYAQTREIARMFNVTIATFGHCGDGNLHVNFMYDDTNPDEKDRVDHAIPELFRRVVQHRGTISGEHGIGIMKQPYLSLEYGTGEQSIMMQIKRVWDPENLLNPGKIFPAPQDQ